MKRGTCDCRAAFRSTQCRYDGRLSIGFGQFLLFHKMWLQRYGARSPHSVGRDLRYFLLESSSAGSGFGSSGWPKVAPQTTAYPHPFAAR